MLILPNINIIMFSYFLAAKHYFDTRWRISSFNARVVLFNANVLWYKLQLHFAFLMNHRMTTMR